MQVLQRMFFRNIPLWYSNVAMENLWKTMKNLWQMEVLRGTSFGNGNCRHIAEHEPETGQDLLGPN